MKVGCIVIISLALLFTLPANAKKQCDKYHQKLQNIQAQQRLAHTNKQAEKLKIKEDKARKKWWACENGKLKTRKKKSRKSR